MQAGSAITALCAFWDNTYDSIDFLPNTATGNSGLCTDAAPTWIYEIDQSAIAAVSEHLKVSIDSTTNKIWVKGLDTGGLVQQLYDVTVIGHLPGTALTANFSF